MNVKETFEAERVRSEVRMHYGNMAETRSEPNASSCCSPGTDTTHLIYDIPEIGELPLEVRALSAGCGDPVTLAELEPGQTVLDLGSGGGIDCFLAAQRVGETGYVIGVDMTPQMLTQARANQANMGIANVDFRLGEIEHLPVADSSVDVILSNCVINLSPDKPQVFRDAFRVLKPGGRLAISDIVADGPLPEALERDLASWSACLAGAIDQGDYVRELERAGFVDVHITPNRLDEAKTDAFLADLPVDIPDPDETGRRQPLVQINGEWRPLEIGDRKPPFSARITARKP